MDGPAKGPTEDPGPRAASGRAQEAAREVVQVRGRTLEA